MVVLGVEAGLLKLSHWQFSRYQQRVEQQAIFSAQPSVTLHGTWLSERTFALINQPNPVNPEAETGWRILTPLQTEAGVVVVDRGYTRPVWQAHQTPDFSQMAPSSVSVTLHGVQQPFPQRKGWLQGPDTATHPRLLMFLNPVRIISETGPRYVISRTPTSENVIAVPPPLPAPMRHLSYAYQWLGLAMAFPLLCLFAVVKNRRRKT